ncbi:3-hydroxyacyl-CoA dehydrogenase [Pseudomonas sp. WHRI 8519]|uniref:3-hydroxyacyl-CoA dehydrogenase n=1 Tax=Pseudomonas sp. WHRI 8519 TaxID=3162567 RepID=UPI0032EF4ECF
MSTALSTAASIGIIGAGTMGAGIVAVALRAGHAVYLHDTRQQALTQGAESVTSSLDRWVKRGHLTGDQRNECLARLTLASELSELSSCSLVVEAIIESLEIKQELFRALEAVVGEHAILASNTSSISITAIAATLQKPQRMVGMHFFNPATVLPLVEVVKGEATCPTVIAQVSELAIKWGKSPVECKSTPGFIVNRVARPFYAEALLALEDRVAPAAVIDAALRDAGGFRMGPLELMDLIGHDTNFAVTRSIYDAFFQDPRYRPSLIQQALVDAGWLGRKTGRGFYRYDQPSNPNEITFEPACPAPTLVQQFGDFPGAQTLRRLAEQHGCRIERHNGDGYLMVDGVQVRPSLGVTAIEIATAQALDQVVLFDASTNLEAASLVVLSSADTCRRSSVNSAVGFFQALGKQVVMIDDVAGMLVTRTLCMLANEAAQAVSQGIATAQAVDLAMLKGVNYPVGPLTWADGFGSHNVVTTLDNLARAYPDGRYRASALLRRKALTNTPWNPR